MPIKVEKSTTNILIENKKYIRLGSIIEEEKESNDKPLIITEGKTDWKHLKKALERFKNNGLYLRLQIFINNLTYVLRTIHNILNLQL
jgi:hypothetical protein